MPDDDQPGAAVQRRQVVGALAALAPPLFGACATGAPAHPSEVVRGLAPQGRLRACINLGNAILARRNEGAPGGVSGVSVDLAQALADELGVPLQTVVVDAAARSVDAVRGGLADVGFFAVDPARSQGLAFTAPYVLIEGAYLVRQGSPLTANEQVDRAGTRVMVARGSAYDLFLARALQQATRLHTVTSQQVVDQFLAQGADVAAGVRQQLQADAARLPGLRLLPGRFMVIEQAMGVQAGRGAAAEAALRRFVEHRKASGFVARALARHGIDGASVAPAAG